MGAYSQWVGENLLTGWTYLKYWKIWTILILGAFMQYIHNTAHNYVYYLASVYGVYGGPDRMLTDLGFKAFEDMPDLSFWPNFSLYFTGALAVSFGMSPFFTRKIIRSPSIHPLQIVWRSIWVCTFTIILRCTSFLITILPAPAPHCSQEDFSPPTTVASILTWFDTGAGCSDLIFSSHEMYGLTAVLAVHFYTVKDIRETQPQFKERMLKSLFVVFMWMLVIWEGIAIVRQQTHYSIDVFTSFYAVPFTWIVFYHFFPSDPVPPALQNGLGAKSGEVFLDSVEADSTQLAI